MHIQEFAEHLRTLNFYLAVEDNKLILKGNREKLTDNEIRAVKQNTEIIDYIKKNKEALIEYVKANQSNQLRKRSDNITSIYGLSSLQQGVLFHGLLHQEGGNYIIQVSCDLVDVDLPVFRQCWHHLLQQHTILRTGFYYDAFNIPVQCVHKNVTPEIIEIDYNSKTPEEQLQQISAYTLQDRLRGFDFEQPPLMRVTLIRVSENRYRMLWTVHHILLDGWSTPVLMQEFLEVYETLINSKQPSLRQEDRYEDYIRHIASRDKTENENYWRQYLRGMQQGTLLPFFNARDWHGKTSDARGEELLHLDAERFTTAELFCKQQRITLNTLVQAVWAYLLHQYTGFDNVIYGVVVSGRPEDLPNVEQRVGMYINTLPLRSEFKNDQSIGEWLRQLQQEQIESRKFQYSGLNEIQACTGITGDLFDTTLTFQNFPVNKLIATREWQLQVSNVYVEEPDNVPLCIIAMASEDLSIVFRYNKELIGQQYVQQIRNHFEQVLLQLVNGAATHTGAISMLTTTEAQQLQAFSLPVKGAHPDVERSVMALFSEQVEQTPNAIALQLGEEQLSYQQLEAKSNQLAHFLRDKGVQQDSVVAVCMERSVMLIITLLGVLKTGCSYVAIDPAYPAQRKKYILEDSGAQLLLTHEASFDELPDGVASIDLAAQLSTLSHYADGSVITTTTGAALAYIMYTSGSTGLPKGVEVTHNNITSLVKGTDFVQMNSSSVLLSTGSPSFDATTFEYWGMLLNGGRLIMCPENVLLDAALLKEEIKNRSVNTMWFTAGWFNELVDTDPSVFENLHTVIAGGDKLSVRHVQRLQSAYPSLQLVNGYGPTENTTFSLTYTINNTAGCASIPIGRPLPYRSAWVLDEQLQLCAIGVVGELYVGGTGLARGYRNRAELTTQKFVADPFNNEPGARLYRTGDRARWLPDGTLEFLGRTDEQVKIRGYRVEPGEIESGLQQYEGIQQAAVVVREDDKQNKQLIAYIVAATSVDPQAVLQHLQKSLPAYMVPSLLIPIEHLPLTSNGKVDRKQLASFAIDTAITSRYIAPRNDTEKTLAAIWQQLLDVEQVGVEDNFFELGGHSLLAIRVISAMRKELQCEIAIRDIFDHPTIAALCNRIDQQKDRQLQAAIQPAKRPDQIPLSFSQERLWFIDRLKNSQQYHMPWVFRLEGHLDEAALESGFRDIIQRHEILRTVIYEQEGIGYQQVQPGNDWTMERTTEASILSSGTTLEEYIHQQMLHPFDLSADHMLRVTLIRCTPTSHILIAVVHHIAFDGWSISILVKELSELYSCKVQNKDAELPALPVQYADYAIWQRKHLAGDVLTNKLQYWKQQLQGVTPLELPTDYERPKEQSIRGAVVSRRINKQIQDGLINLSRQEGVTLFMTLLAAFKVLLHRYSGQTDICVGSSIAGRHQQQVEGLIGFFVNILAFRSDLNGEPSFRSLLQQVRATVLDAYEHQDVPFEKIVDKLGVERDRSRNPIFQVALVLENAPESGLLSLGELSLQGMNTGHATSEFEMTLDIRDTAEGLFCNLVYNADLYRQETMDRFLEHFEQLLLGVVTDISTTIGQLPILSQKEKHQLFEEFAGMAADYPRHQTIIELFQAQVQQSPDNVAIVLDDRRLSYQELHEQSNRLANCLLALGYSKGSRIALLSLRSMDMITGMLGILKIGGVYVPLNIEYPAQRLQYIVEDSNVACILHTGDNLLTRSGLMAYPAIDMTDSYNFPAHAPGIATSVIDPAYIMYTSGTSGTPKGILVNQQNIIKLVYDQGPIRVTADDKVLQWSNYAFDGCTYEIYATLLSGAALYMIGEGSAANAVFLSRFIRDNQITVVFVTTALFNAFVDNGIDSFSGVRKLLFGGEMVSFKHVARALKVLGPGHIVHVYGPTETTTYATSYSIDELEENTFIPIGKPLSNTKARILDALGGLVPVGVPGELYIGGDGVSLGYINKPELTGEKFVALDGNDCWYRTGDRARWTANGDILFLGRHDEQVKLRGYRVELSEIENVLRQAPHVQQAVTMVLQSNQGNKQLVAFIVAGEGMNNDEVFSFMRIALPDYMVPSLLVRLKSIPLNPNGKIDRKLLAEMDMTGALTSEYVAPRNETEQLLAAIWQDLLDIPQVGMHDNFFELGGHSLMAIRVISAVRKQWNREIAIREIFDHPTIAGLAARLDAHTIASAIPPIEQVTRPQRVPLSFSQERLWFIHRLEGSAQYHMHWVFRLKGQLQVAALEQAFNDIINRHEVLRTIIREHDGVGYQEILPADTWRLQYIQDTSILSGTPAAQQAFIAGQVLRPFDLSADHMLRATLVRINAEEHVLIAVIHHIAFDGWSIAIMVKELTELYRSRLENRPATLPVLSLQYADYALWQRQYLSGEFHSQRLAYWQAQLNGIVPLELPVDFDNPRRADAPGAVASHQVPKALLDALSALSNREGVTLFMTLLSVFNVLLYRYSRQNDLCVGTPVAGRDHQEIEGLIGFFINTIVLRTQIAGSDSFRSLLQQVKDTTLKAYAHQDLSFEKIVEALNVPRDPGRNPVFQVKFALQNIPEAGSFDLGDVQLIPEGFTQQTTTVDFSIDIWESAQGLYFTITYNAELYRQETILRMLQHYENMLQAVAHDITLSIDHLKIICAEQDQQLIQSFQGKAVHYPLERTVLDLFRDQVLERPGATALSFNGRQVSYRELDERSNRLAHCLVARGVQKETLVPICVDRGIEMIVGLLGILKSGGAYVPVDTTYPPGRIQQIINDIQPSIAVSSRARKELLTVSDVSLQVIELDGDSNALNAWPVAATGVVIEATQLAYVIFTSGSTGRPKGVMIEHRSVSNLVYNQQAPLNLQAGMAVFQFASFGFDASCHEIFCTLCHGGHLILSEAALLLNSEALSDMLQQYQVALITLPPSYQAAMKDRLGTIQTIISAGEALNKSVTLELQQQGIRVINAYGPTENTVSAVLTPDPIGEDGIVRIGRPLDNVRIYIVDE
ncbi:MULTISPECIES: amino acid adenylation domain-containing protein, partial [Niastella]